MRRRKSKHQVAFAGQKTQICTTCQQEQPLDLKHFAWRKDQRVFRRNCRKCQARNTREYLKTVNPVLLRRKKYQDKLRQFDLTLAEYEAIAAAQGNRCALCRKPEKNRRLAVDHCHQTGQIRGLLCTGCNHALARMGDSTEGVQRVLAYLTGPSQASQLVAELRKSTAPLCQGQLDLSLPTES